jgi:hypothetical protein
MSGWRKRQIADKMEQAMTNPIPRSSLFGTPESLEALDQQIRNLSTDSERAIAYTYTMLAFNLAHRMIEQEKVASNS